MRGDVARLLREALKQDPGDQPFIVFIDLNSPLTPGLELWDKAWSGDIRDLLDEYDVPTPDKPDPMTLLCITNFSHHYQEGLPAFPAEHLVIGPSFVRHNVEAMLRSRLYRYRALWVRPQFRLTDGTEELSPVKPTARLSLS